MVWKIVGVALVVLIILFSFGVVYQNIPREVVEMKTDNINGEPFSIISYGATPVFLENLRFNHNDISYFIGDSCSSVRRSSMIEAFGLFSGMTKYIRFNEVGSEADIDVECSDESIEIGAGLFAAGEGGPSRIINTSRFKVIEKGSIFLYSDSRCERPVVELHELGHVFGFDHSDDPMNIMYNVSNCGQWVTVDMVDLIDALYEIEALADVRISDLSVSKKGRYLDFNISVLNEGLLDAYGIDLSIIVGGEVVEVMEFGDIEIGFGRTLRVENLNLGSSGFDVVEFYIDKDNIVRELDEGNNVVRASV